MTAENTSQLPADFEQQMGAMLAPDELEEFKEALLKPSRTSIRMHPVKKYAVPQSAQQVPWNPSGYFLAKRPRFTLDPLFHTGAYYVQEASSMFIGYILEQIAAPKDGLYLDLCAAPGGKSTLLSSYVGDQGMVVANEVIKARASILKENSIKWGLGNIVVTNNDPTHFEPLEGFFDVVLVDAPCSGEGMFRKDPEARDEWSTDHVRLCAARQQRILDSVGALAADNGYLIYSTCTFNKAENEEMLRFLTQEFAYEPVQIPLDPSWGIVETATETEEGIFYGYRFFPHLVESEGFFVTVLKRPHDAFRLQPKKQKDLRHTVLQRTSQQEKAKIFDSLALPASLDVYKLKDVYFSIQHQWTRHFELVVEVLSVKYFGVELGKFSKDQFIPSHEWAMSTLPKSGYVTKEVNREEALLYLRKEELALDIAEDGWILLSYQGLPLGWAKNLGNRLNNYYPKEWRIRMKLPH